MSNTREIACDVAIAGGGMVGLSLAAALAELPLDVAVVEPVAAGASEQPSFDARTTALSAGSRRILEGIGIWPAVAGIATPIRTIHVSERGSFGFARLTAEEQGVAALGYTVGNREIGEALRARAAVLPRLAVVSDAVSDAVPGGDAIALRTAGGAAVRSRLVVAADGAQSRVRTALGIDAEASDYGQHAVIAHAEAERFHGYTAWERFTPEGPIAVLPIAEGRVAIVWTLAPDAAARALACDDAEFLAGLQRAFGDRLGRFKRVGRRQAYPLSLTRSQNLTAARAVLVGNAAQGLHPVAGQGFNLALRDVAALAEVLADALMANPAADPGAPDLLARYAEWRRPDRQAVIRFTDTLVRGFGNPLRPLRALRATGLLLFDLSATVKHAFARRTMGLAGRLPRLARGLPLAARMAAQPGQAR